MPHSHKIKACVSFPQMSSCHRRVSLTRYFIIVILLVCHCFVVYALPRPDANHAAHASTTAPSFDLAMWVATPSDAPRNTAQLKESSKIRTVVFPLDWADLPRLMCLIAAACTHAQRTKSACLVVWDDKRSGSMLPPGISPTQLFPYYLHTIAAEDSSLPLLSPSSSPSRPTCLVQSDGTEFD